MEELDQCMLIGKSYKNILKKMVLTNDMSKFPLTDSEYQLVVESGKKGKKDDLAVWNRD